MTCKQYKIVLCTLSTAPPPPPSTTTEGKVLYSQIIYQYTKSMKKSLHSLMYEIKTNNTFLLQRIYGFDN